MKSLASKGEGWRSVCRPGSPDLGFIWSMTLCGRNGRVQPVQRYCSYKCQMMLPAPTESRVYVFLLQTKIKPLRSLLSPLISPEESAGTQ